MNRPKKYDNVFIIKARNNMRTHDFIRFLVGEYEELNMYCDELEKALIEKKVMISEDCHSTLGS